MQIGCCAPIENAPQVGAAGFDYIECPLVSLLADEAEAAFRPVLETYNGSAVPVGAFNIFLPRDLKVVGSEVDWERLRRYTARALERARRVGADTVVFGSGAARAIPEGFPPAEAKSQIVRFLHEVADDADKVGVVVVIEPLNRKESNVINSVAEAVELAQQVGRASIRVLADFYHMDEEREPLNHLTQYKDWIAHVHVADTGRGAPGTGHYPYQEFAQRLQQTGYNGLVSVECRWNDFSREAPASVRFLRQILK